MGQREITNSLEIAEKIRRNWRCPVEEGRGKEWKKPEISMSLIKSDTRVPRLIHPPHLKLVYVNRSANLNTGA